MSEAAKHDQQAQVCATANGRVNLIGDHTDYNEGWVLPTAIPQSTNVCVKPLPGNTVRILSSLDPKSGHRRELNYELGEEKPSGEWTDYLQGITSYLFQQGKLSRGFEASVHSTVPEGSGLSSSAALEMAFLKALRAVFALPYSDQELALIGQKIENDFVGAKVGIMDQLACSMAHEGEALLIDTQSLETRRVKLPRDQMELVVINSGVSHRNAAAGGYNERRAQCEEACRLLGLRSLRELDEDSAELNSLPELLRKRATHVVSENARVHKAVSAIESGDIQTLGRLYRESHESLRSLYEVSVPEVDLLVKLLEEEEAVYGARITGGGFGGSVVAVCAVGAAEAVAARVARKYEDATGIHPTVMVPFGREH
jgi:galactokinase